jgi:hypothetical protein
MSNENLNYWQILWKLIWGNRILRSRIIFTIGSFPMFLFIAIFVFQYLGIEPRGTYMLFFLSGLFYHFSITFFSISAVYSYFKYLINHRALLAIFIFIYLIGLLTSIVNCAFLLGLNSISSLQFEVGQVCIAFFISNFVFAPLGFLICSYDFVKIDLFGSNVGFYQPRPIYLSVVIVFFFMFSLLLDARTEYGWSLNLVLLILFVLSGIILAFLKFILKRIYVNCQNSIVE